MKRLIISLLIVTNIAAFSVAQTDGSASFRQEGIASWYGGEFDGKPTASGEIFNSGHFTAAHPTLPFGTILTVTNRQNTRQVTVRINDRGPFVAARIIDLSKAAAEVLDMLTTGTAPVILEQADNTTLGPVTETKPIEIAAEPAPVPPAPPVVPVVTEAPIEELVPLTPAPPPVTPPVAPAVTQAPEPVIPIQVMPAEIPAARIPEAAPQAPIIPPVFYPAPPAEIRGGIPPAGSAKLYRLQVGAYKIPRNAVEAFDKLKNAGLDPAYERSGEFYRVVLAGLKAGDIPSIAQTLGNAGFKEALIRAEN